jgi:hypothetical protein
MELRRALPGALAETPDGGLSGCQPELRLHCALPLRRLQSSPFVLPSLASLLLALIFPLFFLRALDVQLTLEFPFVSLIGIALRPRRFGRTGPHLRKDRLWQGDRQQQDDHQHP